jgi:hypothetical protein
MDKEAKNLPPSDRAEKILNAINDEAIANGKYYYSLIIRIG